MGFTNETLHYGIPLPLGSDLTTPMDYNQAAEAVDAAIFQASTDAAGAASTAGTAQTAAAEAQTAAANAVADAATAHGLADTAVQAASSAQTAAESAQTSSASAVATANAVSAVIGTGTLNTEAQTIIPAINEVNAKTTDLKAIRTFNYVNGQPSPSGIFAVSTDDVPVGARIIGINGSPLARLFPFYRDGSGRLCVEVRDAQSQALDTASGINVNIDYIPAE